MVLLVDMDPIEFARAVALAIGRGLIRKLAEQFDVSEKTVYRWASGAAVPLPRMRHQIMKFIRENS